MARRRIRRSSWANRLARATILTVPAGLILFRGGIYLIDTGQTLLAPGAGITLDYATPKGLLHISAKTYAVDLRSGLARFEGVKVVGPDGKTTLVSIGRAQITGLELGGMDLVGDLHPTVVLTDPFLVVSRGPKGDIDLIDYLPPSDGKPSTTPFEVQIVRGRLEIHDHAAKGEPTHLVRMPYGRLRSFRRTRPGAESWRSRALDVRRSTSSATRRAIRTCTGPRRV